MIFVPVIGVEGSGHAMSKSLMEHPSVSIDGLNREMLDWWHWQDDKHGEIVKQGLKKLEADGKTHYVCTSSFPFDNPRDTLRRPCVPLMFETGCDKTRAVELFRDPIDCVKSAIRRNFTNDWMLQARIVEDNLIYIWFQLESCEPARNNVKIFPYYDFQSKPESMCEYMADWVEMPWISGRHDRIKKPSENNPLTEEQELFVKTYFERNWFYSI